ncbi:hypothetical protein [uncultured Lamprocystis sp.]|uniref:hypothetical protein n=1 Tax=uncultured Lamprocystis sp. TaxID=543132 RepID=UPI0025D02623|nr:hypothetical protein [uncultured Lamprocystis sp.]
MKPHRPLAEQLRNSVSERDGQVATFIATVEAEQPWAEVAEARAGETALTEEKNTLTLEAQRSRQDLTPPRNQIGQGLQKRCRYWPVGGCLVHRS